ncbi:hypothetical protein AB0M36_16835 [Actinoplanes sp. NPDC051346]|uniref:LysM peptidoglycan-binding domain-containing protein n=1 Tax=Actinoplanes sp. NPDC051346 TaxID=3155048 RepID=UPI00341A3AA3
MRARLTTVAVIVALVTVTHPGPAVAKPPPGPGHAKYYVVGTSPTGQPQYLYDIAVRTLGNGKRYPEIVKLNADRPQPDGDRLTDPLRLHVGWILVLPADASGPGVRVGAPPTVPPATTGAPQAASGSPQPGPAPVGAGHGSWRDTPAVRWGGVALAVILALLAGTFVAAPPRRRRPRPPRPAVATVGVTTVGPSKPTEPPGSLVPVPAPVLAAVPVLAAAPVPAAVHGPDGAAAGVAAVATVPAAVDARQAGMPGEAIPELLVTRVTCEQDELSVSLLGARGEADEPAFVWCGTDEPTPDGPAFVLLGDHGGRRLYVDLTRTPDVLTVTGETENCRRVARRLAERVATAGADVLVLSGALGDQPPSGARALDEIPAEPPEPANRFGVVFCAGPGATASARRLATANPGRLLPILLGEVPRARWSVGVRVRVPTGQETVDSGTPGRKS